MLSLILVVVMIKTERLQSNIVQKKCCSRRSRLFCVHCQYPNLRGTFNDAV